MRCGMSMAAVTSPRAMDFVSKGGSKGEHFSDTGLVRGREPLSETAAVLVPVLRLRNGYFLWPDG